MKDFDKVVEYLESNFEEYYFGGTISLYLFDIVGRSPKDIDIILRPDIFKTFKYETLAKTSDLFTESISDEGEDDIVSLTIGGYTVDFICLSSDYEVVLKSKGLNKVLTGTFIYKDKTLPFIHPLSAIDAKKRYIQSAITLLDEGKELSDVRKTSLFKHINDVNSFNSQVNHVQMHVDLTHYLNEK